MDGDGFCETKNREIVWPGMELEPVRGPERYAMGEAHEGIVIEGLHWTEN